MLDHILALIAENSTSLRAVIQLVIGILRGVGIDARLSEHYGGSDGTHLVIHLRGVREV